MFLEKPMMKAAPAIRLISVVLTAAVASGRSAESGTPEAVKPGVPKDDERHAAKQLRPE